LISNFGDQKSGKAESEEIRKAEKQDYDCKFRNCRSGFSDFGFVMLISNFAKRKPNKAKLRWRVGDLALAVPDFGTTEL
jgi:hypothetical protein